MISARGPLRRLRRVLMTTDTVGGVWTYAVELAHQLRWYGIDVQLASMGPSATPEQRAELAREQITLHESGYALEWMDDPWRDVDRAGAWLLELERELQPDIVHLNGYCHAVLPFRAPVCVVAHSCVLSWWSHVFGVPAPERYAEYRRRVGAGLRAAACVVAPTAAMLRDLADCYGPVLHGLVIPNGIELRSVRDEAARVSPKHPVILAAGRVWDRAKNLNELAAAAEGLAWPVRIAGEHGESRGAALPNVTLLGRLSRAAVELEMTRAAVFAHPARYEPFGLAPLEAALHGAALVLGDIPSLREVWGGAALYARPGELRHVLARVSEDEPLRKILAERAQIRAREYGAERMARAYLRSYEALLGCERARNLPRERSEQRRSTWEHAR